MTSRKDKILADPALAKLVREGLMTLPTNEDSDPPPLKPVLTLKEVMKGLDADREDRI
jgi:hypothetical protein